MLDIEHLKKLASDEEYSELNYLVMTDTLKECENNPDLVDAIKNSISRQYILLEEDDLIFDNKH
jgi:hypothetical protein